MRVAVTLPTAPTQERFVGNMYGFSLFLNPDPLLYSVKNSNISASKSHSLIQTESQKQNTGKATAQNANVLFQAILQQLKTQLLNPGKVFFTSA